MEEPQIHQRLLSQMKVRHLANIFLGATLLIVLGVTLYPFDFTTDGVQRRLGSFFAQSSKNLRASQDDIITNIILFVPVGFGVGILASRNALRLFKGTVVSVLAGALLSLLVELLQVLLPFRYASALDIAANAVGSLVGYFLFALVSPFLYRGLTKAVARGNAGYSAGWFAAGYVAYLLFMVLASIPFQEAALPNEFDKYPLCIGNEPTGARAWRGAIQELIVTRHGLSAAGVAHYLTNHLLHNHDSEMVIAHYRFDGFAPYRDLRGFQQSLQWSGAAIESSAVSRAADRAHLTPHRWLQTPKHVYELSSWLMGTRRFTICATVASASAQQPDNARIVCIAADPWHQNVALVQMGDGLGIRIRSMTAGVNGTNPRFIVPHVFSDRLLHRIVVVLDKSLLHVYVDTMERHYALELGPGFGLLHRMFPTNGMLDMTSSLKSFHNIFFSVIVFVPLGYLLGVFVQQVRVGILAIILIVVVGILTPPYLLEHVLQYWTGRPIITSNLLLGMTLMTGMLLLTFLPATIKSTGLLKDAASP
jgi:glycopeptide antibiotics resistance protein